MPDPLTCERRVLQEFEKSFPESPQSQSAPEAKADKQD